jgi:hypothetical protein
MKLLLSALVLAALLPAASAQNQTGTQTPSTAVAVPAQNPSAQQIQDPQVPVNDLVAHKVILIPACPLFFTNASVAAPAGYLPVGNRKPDEGMLNLQFRNVSGKAIRSASVSATVKVKTNIYALDAHPIVLQLRFSGVDDVDRALDQMTQIALPRHYYLFGLAQVILDRVTYEDGTSWTAPRKNYCGTQSHGMVQAK